MKAKEIHARQVTQRMPVLSLLFHRIIRLKEFTHLQVLEWRAHCPFIGIPLDLTAPQVMVCIDIFSFFHSRAVRLII
jgi:hypothetical protein